MALDGKSEKDNEAGQTGVSINQHLCKACGLCIHFCPKKVLRPGPTINEMGYSATEYIGEGCIGCGNCFYICPEPGTIRVQRPDRKKGGQA